MKKRLERISEEIVATYGNVTPKIHHLDRSALPSREVVINIIEALQEIIYPGYFNTNGIPTSQAITARVQERIEWLYENLRDQIFKSLRHGRLLGEDDCIPSERTADECAIAFIESIPDLRCRLAKDVQAAYDGDPAAKCIDEIIFSYPGVYAITVYRIAHELRRLDVPLLPRIMTEYAHSRTGIDIHPGARIGESFFIDHGTGVVIGETTDIGNNVKLYQGVTLGALSFPKDSRGRIIRGRKRHPTIEDDVVIYAGATILGGDTVIGQGSVIGGNVWLIHSVPPGTRVLQEEPQLRIITPEDIEQTIGAGKVQA